MSHCQRCHSPLDASDLRCPICSLAAPENVQVQAGAARSEVLRCDDCGAAVSYTIEHQAPRCGFCGSVMHVERPDDPLEEPESYLPFLVSPTQAEGLLATWLRTQRGFFTPSELASQARFAGLMPIWWVAWLSDTSVYVTWTADSDAGSQRAAWAPHSGAEQMAFQSMLVPATRGLTYDEAAYLTPGFNLHTGVPTVPQAGVAVERFDVQRSVARAYLVESIHRAAAAQLVKTSIPGRRTRKVRVSALISSMQTRRLALPSYVLAYRYKGELFRAVVHGQDARYVWGRTPRTYFRLYMGCGIALLVVFGACCFLIVLALF